jgi:hypothetical protein
VNYIPTATESGSDDLHPDEFDADTADWYIMQCAFERGEEPYRTLQRVRAAQARVQGILASEEATNGETPALTVAAEATDPTQPWPPGRAGRLARLIYDRSYSPIREVAVAATLGVLAGVAGRAYRTYTGKDLGLYIILIARSGVGKDGIHEGIPYLLKVANVPMAEYFLRAQDFVSGEALHKELLATPGFLNLQGEFGRKLKRMANPHDTPMQNLRTVMTGAFGKQFLEGKTYSNSDNNLLGVCWPALSFLGETTPSTYLECLTPDMAADGFLSRFLSINYEGDRPPPNRNREGELDDDDLKCWRALLTQALPYQMPLGAPPACEVVPNDDAREKLERFEIDCIANLHATDDEGERAVWTRAHLKALKVCSLLAVADNPFVPAVRIEHVAWALNLIREDVAVYQSRRKSGDVGSGDDAREGKLIAMLKDYLLNAPKPSYKVPGRMHEHGVVPRSYLQIRTTSLPAFHNHRMGSSKALDEAIRSLTANGYVKEVKEHDLTDTYRFNGKAYRILRLPG